MLNTGTLDRRIVIERNVPSQDVDGAIIENWQRLGRKRWARRYHLDGTERFTSDQFIAREQVAYVVRWARDLADVNPKDRVVYPITDSPTDAEIYDVISVEEIGYREGLRLITARRAEA